MSNPFGLAPFFYKKSQQINKNTIKFYSNVAFQLPKKRNAQLDPIFITGFVDGEGSFKINIVEDQNYKTGFHVWLFLSISLHVRDRALLDKLQLTLGVGRISSMALSLFNYKLHQSKRSKK